MSGTDPVQIIATQIANLDDKLGRKLDGIRDQVAEVGERVARQEESGKSLWREVRSVGSRIDLVPNRIEAAVSAHAQACVGREATVRTVARSHDRTSRRTPDSIAPEPASARRGLRGIVLPNWVLYAGIIPGVAIAIVIWVLRMLLAQ